MGCAAPQDLHASIFTAAPFPDAAAPFFAFGARAGAGAALRFGMNDLGDLGKFEELRWREACNKCGLASCARNGANTGTADMRARVARRAALTLH